jgi:hypothetical protein
MADYRIIRLALSDAGSTAAEGVELTDAEILAKTEAGDLRLAHDPIIYTGIVGMCVDYSGNIYGVSNTRHCVVKIEEGGRVSWVAGSQTGANGNNGTKNNVPAAAARFNAPEGIACDKSGTLYIADSNNNQIRTIKNGKVNVLAGSALLSGFVDGAGETARFNNPIDIAVDKAGIVWVADRLNHALRKIMSNGEVLTVSGRLPIYGGPTAGDENNEQADNHSAQLSSPICVTVDLQGNVYVGCNGTKVIKKYTADGWLYRYSGGGNTGKSLGLGGHTIATCSQFTCSYTNLFDLAADASGNVYVLDYDTTRSRLLKLDRDGVPAEVADWDSNSYSAGPMTIAMSPAQTLFVSNIL